MFAFCNKKRGKVWYMGQERTNLCIDMKTFYASVECAERGLNPFETNLVVADLTRGKNALCLAITPKLKTLGIKIDVGSLKSLLMFNILLRPRVWHYI